MVTTKRTYTLADFFIWPDDGDDSIYDILGGISSCATCPTSNTAGS